MSRSVPFSAAALAAALSSIAVFPAYSQNANPSDVETLVAALGTGDTPVLALCQTAGADPAAFDVLRGTAQFEAAMVAMTPYCPELVLLLTDLATASLPTAGGGDGAGGVDVVTPVDPDGGSPDAPDYAGLIDALNGATERLELATLEVGAAQGALSDAIGMVKLAGIETRMAFALTDIQVTDELMDEDILRRVLPDFTDEQVEALENLRNKREALKIAREDLTAAQNAVKTELETIASQAEGALRAYLIEQEKLDPDATEEEQDQVLAALIDELSTALTEAADAVTAATTQRNGQLTALQQEFPDLVLDPEVSVGTQITAYRTGLGTTKSQVQTSIDGIQSAINSLVSQRNTAQTTLGQAQQRLAGAAFQLSTAQTAATRELSERDAAQTLLNNARTAETAALNAAISAITQAAASCPAQGACSVRSLNTQLQGKTLEEQRQILLTANLQGNLPTSVSGAVNMFRNANTAIAPLQTSLTQAENELAAANQLVSTLQGLVNQETANVSSAQTTVTNLTAQIQQQQGALAPLQTQITTINTQVERLTAILNTLNQIDIDLPGLEGAKESAQSAIDALNSKLDVLQEAEERLANESAIVAEETGEEQLDVRNAYADLRAAIERAQAALELGKGEAEALADVQSARERLDLALTQQQQAVVDGEELAESVEDPSASPELQEAFSGLTEAIDGSAGPADEAQVMATEGERVENKYHASNTALEAEIEDVLAKEPDLANELRELSDLGTLEPGGEADDGEQLTAVPLQAAPVAPAVTTQSAREVAPAEESPTESAPSSDSSSSSDASSSSSGDSSSSSSSSSDSSSSSSGDSSSSSSDNSSSDSSSSSSDSSSSSSSSSSTDSSSPSESSASSEGASTGSESTDAGSQTTEPVATE